MFPGTYVPRYLCSPVPMFPEPMFPGIYVPRYLCSPNLCSPVPMFPGTPNLCSPVPMFLDLLQMCCRSYIHRPSDRHWNCRAAKRSLWGVSTMFPGTYVPRYLCSPNLCSPVPMFPGTYVPRTYVPRYLCSPIYCKCG